MEKSVDDPRDIEHRRIVRRRPGFFGREGELATLLVTLGEAAAGCGRLAVLTGEAGIGKTSIASALAVAAEEQGFTVLWGRCPDATGAPAFWPFSQILRDYRSRSRRQGGELARLERHLQAPPEHQDAAPEQARFELFERVASALRAAARETPLLLILDDLHWADPSSVKLLCYVAREIAAARVAVLATFREAEPSAPLGVTTLLGELSTLGRTVPVRGLERDDVARLLAEQSAGTADPRLVERIHDATQGNPLFVGEVVRLLIAERRLSDAGSSAASLPIPLGVRAAIARRSEALDTEAREVLAAAAVCGREFSVSVLERAAELPTPRVRAALEAAEGLGLVTPATARPGGFVFVHALMREALYEALPSSGRAAWHRRVGHALEQAYARDPGPHLAALADHFRAAGDPASLERAVDYAQRAGESAQRLLAYEEAERELTIALQVLDDCSGATAERRCAILLALAEAQRGCGRVEPMAATFREAIDLARGLDAVTFAAAVLRYSGARTEFSFYDASLVALLEEALAKIPDAPATLRARLLARLASALLLCPGTEARRAALSEEATTMARALGDPSTLASVLAMRMVALSGPDNLQERLALAGETLRLANESGDAVAALEAQTSRVHDLLELGDIRAFDLAIDAFAQCAKALKQPIYLWHLTTWRSMRALLEGRLDEAEALTAEALAAGQRAAQTTAMMHYGQQLLALRFEQGRMRELEGLIRMAAEQAPTVPSWRIELLSMELQNDRRAEAQAMLDGLAAHGFRDLPRDTNWLLAMISLAFSITELDDAARARQLYELLRPYAGRFVASRPAVVFMGCVSYYLARLARCVGLLDLAAEHFACALREHAQLGARGWVARTQADHAQLLAARGRLEDEALALRLAEEALATAEELAHVELLPRAQRALADVRERTAAAAWGLAGGARLALAAGAHGAATPGRGAVIDFPSRRPPGAERAGGPVSPRAVRPASTPSAPAYACRREGAIWTIVFEGRTVRERHSLGLGYIGHLLANEGRDVTAWELAALDGLPDVDGPGSAGRVDPALRVAAHPGEALAAGDARAIAEYRERVGELRGEAEAARQANDLGRLERVEDEIRFIETELTGLVGLGARARLVGSPAERARLRVTKAIRYAIRKLAAHDAGLAEHLDASVKTGMLCSYAPRPSLAGRWSIG